MNEYPLYSLLNFQRATILNFYDVTYGCDYKVVKKQISFDATIWAKV